MMSRSSIGTFFQFQPTRLQPRPRGWKPVSAVPIANSLRLILRLEGASTVLLGVSDDEREEAEQQAEVGPVDLVD
jgi:hypothetical protein